MEYFSSDPRVLHDISKHYQTGDKLDLETLEKFAASKKIFVAADIQSQLCYSLLDQRLHAQQTPKSSTTDIMREIHQEHHSLPFSDGTAWQHRFSHLVRKQLSILGGVRDAILYYKLFKFEVATCRTFRLMSKKAILEIATSNLQK